MRFFKNRAASDSQPVIVNNFAAVELPSEKATLIAGEKTTDASGRITHVRYQSTGDSYYPFTVSMHDFDLERLGISRFPREIELVCR